MQKSLIITSLLGLMLLVSPVFAQSGQALLKIVVNEDGTRQVVDLRDQNRAAQTSSQINETFAAPPPSSAPNDDAFQTEGTMACGHNLTWEAGHTAMSYNSPDLSVRVRVMNNGEPCAIWAIKETVLGYYLSTDANITTADFRFGTDNVRALNFGEFSDENISYEVTQVGTWYVGFIIDYTNQQQENDENDNAYAFPNPVSYNPKPNLSYSKNHSNFNFNDPNLTINVRVINTNDTPSGSSHLGYYLSSDQNLTKSDYRIGESTVGSLTAGNPSDESLSVDLTTVNSFPPLPTGTHTYYVGFIVDYRDEVDELNENDNAGLFNQPITFTKPVPRPNLTLVADHCNYTYSTPNLTINARVSNNSSVRADSCRLGYYLSTDALITLNDLKIGESVVGALPANSTSDHNLVDINLTQFGLTSGQTYYIGLFVDCLENITETNENDNTLVLNPPITAPVVLPNLTLVADHCNYTYSTPNLTINARVSNNGSAVADSCCLGYYLSTDALITSTDLKIGESVVSALPANSTSDHSLVNINLTQFGLTPGQTYYVGLFVDCLENVDETNENDNTLVFNPPITIPQTGLYPNLVINPDTAVSNASFNYPFLTIQTRVLNTGAVASDTCRLTYYVFKDTLDKATSTRLGSVLVDSLSPGGFQNLTPATFNLIELGFSEGEIIGVGAIIDELEQVPEFNEYDNQHVFRPWIEITKPSAWLTNFRLTPPSPAYLHHEEWVYMRYNYTHEGSGYINVHIKPFSNENEQLDAEVSEPSIANAHYPGTGFGTVAFRICSGTERVDYIRLRICPFEHPETVIWQTFIPVEYHYSGNKIDNIQFSPPSPDNLYCDEAVNTTFDYCTSETGGVRIYAIPYTNGMPTPFQYYGGTTNYAEGSGSGSRFFGVHSGVFTVDQVQFIMKSQVTNQLIYEKYVPVSYLFNEVRIYCIRFSPESPAELANNQCAEISFKYNDGWGTDIIHLIPYSAGNETPHAKICEYGNFYLDDDDFLGWIRFTIESGDVTVDQVKLQVKRADGRLVGEIMLQVEYHFGSAALAKAPTDETAPDDVAIPTKYRLCQNHPNPFNPVTTIAYDLPDLSTVKLTIFNLQGQIVYTQEPGLQTAGRYSLQWNGCNAAGQPVASGMYFYRLEAIAKEGTQKSFVDLKKMILMK